MVSRVKKIISIFSVVLLLGTINKEVIAGTVLVTNVASNTVSLVDSVTLQTVNLPTGFKPHEVAVTPNGQFALVSNFGTLMGAIPGNSLTSIDIEHAKILQTIELPKGSRPHGIYFISDNEALVTEQGSQSLLRINFREGKVIKTIALPGEGAHMVTVDVENKYAYVANAGSGTVTKIDLRNDTVVKEVNIGKTAEGIALTLDEQWLW